MLHWLSLLILILLLCLTTWLHTSMNSGFGEAFMQDGNPDSVMLNFTRTDMNESGIAKATLSAPLMKHFPLDDSAELERPTMQIYNQEGLRPWQITADRGWLSGDGEKLLLFGDVYIWRTEKEADPDDEDSPKEIEMITTDLMVLTKEQYAQTENFVMILTPNSRVTAVGMKANLQKRQLKLLNEVRGRYENTKQ